MDNGQPIAQPSTCLKNVIGMCKPLLSFQDVDEILTYYRFLWV